MTTPERRTPNTAGVSGASHCVSVRPTFQLPTSCATLNPNSISVKRESPRHMTMLPGGGSLARAR
jgi:hypothetical protein